MRQRLRKLLSYKCGLFVMAKKAPQRVRGRSQGPGWPGSTRLVGTLSPLCSPEFPVDTSPCPLSPHHCVSVLGNFRLHTLPPGSWSPQLLTCLPHPLREAPTVFPPGSPAPQDLNCQGPRLWETPVPALAPPGCTPAGLHPAFCHSPLLRPRSHALAVLLPWHDLLTISLSSVTPSSGTPGCP